MTEKTLKKGEIIFKDGDLQNCMYQLRWGSVAIYIDYQKPNEFLTTTLYPDALFADQDLLEAVPHNATAVALEENTVVSVITMADYEEFCREQPAKVVAMMQDMSKRLRGLSKDYLELNRKIDRLEAQLEACGGKPETEPSERRKKKSIFSSLESLLRFYWYGR